MDNLSSSFLKYGSEVLLYSEQMVGFLYSEGWFDETVYLPKVEKDKVKYLFNFVFQVNPKLSYDARKQLSKMKNTNGKNEVVDEQQKVEAQDFFKNKEIMEKRCEKEEFYNNRTKKTKSGEFVVYGNEIELLHRASGKIVTVVKNAGGDDAKFGNFLELKEQGSPNKCVFKILPRYKYRAEGEKIIYGDYFILYNEKTKSNVYISPNVINKSEIYANPPSYRPKVKFRRTPTQSLFSKNVMELKQRTSSRLQFIPFRQADLESQRFVSGGDIVRINLVNSLDGNSKSSGATNLLKSKTSDIGGHLCVDGSIENNGKPICFVRKYRGMDTIEEKDSNCLFEIEMN